MKALGTSTVQAQQPAFTFATFDPRSAPVLRTFADSPLVPPERLAAQGLKSFFQSAARRMTGTLSDPLFMGPPPRQAAVLVPVMLRSVPTLLLTQRTSHLRKHAGQIAFPGGKMDETDADVVETALREAQEEVGLPPGQVEVLGTLPSHSMTPVYGITPVVGLVQPGWAVQPNPHEVADVFEVPLAFLMDPANHRYHERDIGSGRIQDWLSILYADAQGERFIWGATAAMLHGLYRALAGSL